MSGQIRMCVLLRGRGPSFIGDCSLQMVDHTSTGMRRSIAMPNANLDKLTRVALLQPMVGTQCLFAALVLVAMSGGLSTATAQSSDVTFGYADAWVKTPARTGTQATNVSLRSFPQQVFKPTPDPISTPPTSSYSQSAPLIPPVVPAVPSPAIVGSPMPSTAPLPNMSSPSVCSPTACCACSQGPCDECGRRLAFDISSVFYRRSQPESQSLFQNPLINTEAIDASNFGFDMTTGIEAGLIVYDHETSTDLELRGLFPGTWTSSQFASFSGSTVQIDATPPLATSGPRTGFVTYQSEFWSAEANARYRMRNLAGTTLVAGFRMLRLTEQLDGRLVSPTATLPDEVISIATDNRLFGFQVGADYVFHSSCCWCFRVKGRLGMYGNDGNQQSNLISLATPPVTFPAGGGNDSLAFHGEFGIDAKYKLSECVNLLFAYRLMVLDGVALAPNQLAATDFVTRAGYGDGGSVLLNGFHIGMELVY